jgi:hypothetical protein
MSGVWGDAYTKMMMINLFLHEKARLFSAQHAERVTMKVKHEQNGGVLTGQAGVAAGPAWRRLQTLPHGTPPCGSALGMQMPGRAGRA